MEMFSLLEALFTYNLIINSQAFPFKDVLQNLSLPKHCLF